MSKLANDHRHLSRRVAVTGRWVVCQIGARENFAVARALHWHGELEALITDAWSPDIAGLERLVPRFAQRHHAELAGANVIAPTLSAIGLELRARLSGVRGMARNILRNEWFQRQAVDALARLRDSQRGPLTVFAYSYAAAGILAFARERGWRTVLGQIDPGIAEDRIVQAADPAGYSPKPDSYWASWRRELELADSIVVNSEWSRAGLEQEGVSREKIAVVPLVQESGRANRSPDLPERFSRERPLHVLFLGQIIPRKGVRALLDAIHELKEEPIEFHFVGPSSPQYERELRGGANIVWHGAVARARTRSFYEAADAFILPTLSDGFGLTQLEAMSCGVPVIASRACGEVVRDGENGLILETVSGEEIAAALRKLAGSPALLSRLRHGAAATRPFGIEDLHHRLTSLDHEPRHVRD
jgi:glycosyltransferase involved in cell wall biosynthesis